MSLNENDLLAVVNQLRQQGYTDSIQIVDGKMYSIEDSGFIDHKLVELENGYQFEITENATDTQLLFTYTDKAKNSKGLIIDLLGSYYYNDEIFSQKLKTPLQVYVTNEQSPTKYGLRKVYKKEFDENPNKFEFKIDFPDFPTCPFGFGYKALGWDKEKQEYVWFVTSIIKDEKLIIKRY